MSRLSRRFILDEWFQKKKKKKTPRTTGGWLFPINLAAQTLSEPLQEKRDTNTMAKIPTRVTESQNPKRVLPARNSIEPDLSLPGLNFPEGRRGRQNQRNDLRSTEPITFPPPHSTPLLPIPHSTDSPPELQSDYRDGSSTYRMTWVCRSSTEDSWVRHGPSLESRLCVYPCRLQETGVSLGSGHSYSSGLGYLHLLTSRLTTFYHT